MTRHSKKPGGNIRFEFLKHQFIDRDEVQIAIHLALIIHYSTLIIFVTTPHERCPKSHNHF